MQKDLFHLSSEKEIKSYFERNISIIKPQKNDLRYYIKDLYIYKFRKHKIICVDFGISAELLNLLSNLFNLILVPRQTLARSIKLLKPDGIIFSDGITDIDFIEQNKENLKSILELKIPKLSFENGSEIICYLDGNIESIHSISSDYSNYKIYDSQNQSVISCKKNKNTTSIKSFDNIKLIASNIDDDNIEAIELEKYNATCFFVLPKTEDLESLYFFENFCRKML